MKTSTGSHIDVHELHRRLGQGGSAVLLDVRTPAEFAAAHVPGARNVPLGSVRAHELAAQHTAGAPLYVICASGGRSQKCCAELARAGFNDAISVSGGTGAWAEAGYPLEHQPGGGVISLERQVRIAAGSLVLAGMIAGTWLHPAFYGLAAFVGAGLVFAGVTDWCGMGLLLARMPWNRRPPS